MQVIEMRQPLSAARPAALVLCCVLAVSPATGLALAVSANGTQRQAFAAQTQGVLVDVEVKRDGYPVGGLIAADFELRDNGILQTCEVAQNSDAPVNVVLALDSSASTTGQRLADLVAAGRTLLAALKPGDRVALETFQEHIAARFPLTPDLAAVGEALGRVVPSGNTSLLDGVYGGLLTTEPAVGPSLVVVYTDGADTTSWLQLAEVRDAASRLDAVMVAVVVRGGYQGSDLQELAATTGGEVIGIDSTANLKGEFTRILHEFRSRYQLTFTPSGVQSGGFHKLDVHVKGRGLAVRARPGYFDAARGR
jgi:Ca-activated chloride channel family protein